MLFTGLSTSSEDKPQLIAFVLTRDPSTTLQSTETVLFLQAKPRSFAIIRRPKASSLWYRRAPSDTVTRLRAAGYEVVAKDERKDHPTWQKIVVGGKRERRGTMPRSLPRRA